MDGDRHDQSRNVARHLVEYDVDRLVIPIGVAGPVVARVLDRTACAPKLTVKMKSLSERTLPWRQP